MCLYNIINFLDESLIGEFMLGSINDVDIVI